MKYMPCQALGPHTTVNIPRTHATNFIATEVFVNITLAMLTYLSSFCYNLGEIISSVWDIY